MKESRFIAEDHVNKVVAERLKQLASNDIMHVASVLHQSLSNELDKSSSHYVYFEGVWLQRQSGLRCLECLNRMKV